MNRPLGSLANAAAIVSSCGVGEVWEGVAAVVGWCVMALGG